MERTAIQKLVKWNESKRRKPLIVWGARQVGKTYLIKDIFAKKHYKNNFLYIDFKIEDAKQEPIIKDVAYLYNWNLSSNFEIRAFAVNFESKDYPTTLTITQIRQEV